MASSSLNDVVLPPALTAAAQELSAQETTAQEPASQKLATQDEGWMRLAIAEARLAEVAGEVPVGAIVLSPEGTVIGRGSNGVLHAHDPSAHAEILALRSAGAALGNYRLLGCTLVCTLEPCAMCAGALLHARVRRLVFAVRDPKAGACGSVLEVLNHPAANHTVAVTEGVLDGECGALLRDFFRRRRAEQAASRSPRGAAEKPNSTAPASDEPQGLA